MTIWPRKFYVHHPDRSWLADPLHQEVAPGCPTSPDLRFHLWATPSV